jgi:hypothetical protein
MAYVDLRGDHRIAVLIGQSDLTNGARRVVIGLALRDQRLGVALERRFLDIPGARTSRRSWRSYRASRGLPVNDPDHHGGASPLKGCKPGPCSCGAEASRS